MYFTIILKTIILYFFIIFSYRLMGKKEVGELGVIDLIVTFLIAELAAICIEESSKSILTSILPISSLVIMQISISYISLKSEKIRDIFDGKPSMIIKKGKVNFSQMTKLRYNLTDLISQLREKGIKNIEEVDYAILENSGNLSVFEKTNDYPLPIILDGVIDFDVVKELKKDYNWIFNLLKKENIKLEDVFYAFYTKQKTYIIKKGDLI